MSELHIVTGDVGSVLSEFGEILWSECGEAVLDGATDAQLAMDHGLSSDELLKAGFMAGVRTALVKTVNGDVAMELRPRGAEPKPQLSLWSKVMGWIKG